MFYEIQYFYKGEMYNTTEYPAKGWESGFFQKVLNRIESITAAGGAVLDVILIKE